MRIRITSNTATIAEHKITIGLCDNRDSMRMIIAIYVFIEITIIYINYRYYRVVIARVTPASSHDSSIKSIVTLFHIINTGS